MTTTTTNLSLTLYDGTADQSADFLSFREDLAGNTTVSNFYKIDVEAGLVQGRLDSLELIKGSMYYVAATGSSPTYTATVAEFTGLTYPTGMMIVLSLSSSVTGTSTININTVGVASLVKINTAGTAVNLASGDLKINKKYLFRYDGTQFVWVSANSGDQTNIAGTSGNVVTVNSDNTLLGTTTQSLLLSQTTNSATEKTTPADADYFPMIDSAASNILKKISYLKVRDAIITYFNSLAATLTNKTLTSPIISTISNTGTLTLPTSTDTLVGKATTDTLTNKRVNKRVSTVALSATPTIDIDNYDVFAINSLSMDVTSFTTGLTGTPSSLQSILFRIVDNGTARALTWGASYIARGATMPTTTVAGKYVYIGFVRNGATSTWDCVAVSQEA
jgi:hypothetical protein